MPCEYSGSRGKDGRNIDDRSVTALDHSRQDGCREQGRRQGIEAQQVFQRLRIGVGETASQTCTSVVDEKVDGGRSAEALCHGLHLCPGLSDRR